MSVSSTPLSTTQIKHFLFVAETGSYSIAAKRANRSQSAVSLSVRQLESRLGELLFEASSRTTLTPFGEQCLPVVKALVDQAQHVVELLSNLARGRGGTLRIASVGTAQRMLLRQLLPRFAREFPDVGIALTDSHSANVERSVLAHEVDFGICSPTLKDDRLEIVPLFSQKLGVVCAETHPLSKRNSLKWGELDDVSLIGSPIHQLVKDIPATKILLSCKHYASHIGPMLELLRLGAWATVLGSYAVPTTEKKMCFIRLTHPTVKVELALVKLKGRTLLPYASAMESLILVEARHLRM